MKYQYDYRITASDLWQMSMYSIYGSLAGMGNLVFTGAMLALAGNKWSVATGSLRVLLIIACIWFPLIQPLLIYVRMRKQAAASAGVIRISFEEQGICINPQKEPVTLPWEQVRGIIRRPTMLILLIRNKQGIALSNRILHDEKNGLYADVLKKLDPN